MAKNKGNDPIIETLERVDKAFDEIDAAKLRLERRDTVFRKAKEEYDKASKEFEDATDELHAKEAELEEAKSDALTEMHSITHVSYDLRYRSRYNGRMQREIRLSAPDIDAIKKIATTIISKHKGWDISRIVWIREKTWDEGSTGAYIASLSKAGYTKATLTPVEKNNDQEVS